MTQKQSYFMCMCDENRFLVGDLRSQDPFLWSGHRSYSHVAIGRVGHGTPKQLVRWAIMRLEPTIIIYT